MSEKKIQFVPAFTLIEEARRKLGRFKYRILVISGKGGVGKSVVSSMIAIGLSTRGRKVSLLDADIHGSSIPLILGLSNTRHYANENGEIIPVEGPLGVKVVAVNLMLDSPDIPVVWRGPLLGRAVIELTSKVAWDYNDYLVVDMPPGTGDVAITISQIFPKPTSGILVTAPNVLSEIIVSKTVNFAMSTGIKLLGIIENMSYFKCPHCGEITHIMGKTGAEKLAEKYGLNLIGKIPLDPEINNLVESGEIKKIIEDSTLEPYISIQGIIDRIISLVEQQDLITR
ncbi:MAG: Mrp/NBP35 family ATP-binding protein [Desulfurococcaceae archaeon]